MRGHHGAALGHAQSGIKILAAVQNKTYDSNESTNGYRLSTSHVPLISMDALTLLFTRLDTQVCELLPDRLDRILQPAEEYEIGFGPTIPHKFHSITEARNCFDYLYNDVIHAAKIVRDPSNEIAAQLHDTHTSEALERFALWDVAFASFLRNPRTRLDSKAKQAANMLNLQQITMRHTFSTMGIPGEMLWDHFSENYAGIIELAEAILKHDGSDRNSKKGTGNENGSLSSIRAVYVDAGVSISQQADINLTDRTPACHRDYDTLPIRTFSMDAGVIVPLFNLIWKCRISHIRRQGIALLKFYPRQEGIWDGVLVSIACERIVAIEEEGIEDDILDPADLPEWKRILQVAVVFDMENRSALLEYSKMTGQNNAEIVKIVDNLYW
jgi:hypothetical protein